MKSAWMLAAVMTATLLSGCARYFHAPAPAPVTEGEGPTARGAAGPRVAPLPADLAWLGGALRLFNAVEPGSRVQLGGESAAPDETGGGSYAAAGSGGGALPMGVSRRTNAGGETDLRFVTLPLTAIEASGMAPVPASVEAAVGPALLSSAQAAAQRDGRLVALPVAARWLALAWNPTRLGDSPAPVPPHLEAWVDQLRALRSRQPEHPPLIAAWGEKEIASAFALLLAANGGRLLDDAGQPAFVSPAGEATVRLMLQLLEERLVQPTALETTTDRLAASLSGPYAYWLCSSDVFATSSATDRIAALRLSGLPMAREQYHYPDAATAVLAQFRGVAVAGGSRRSAAVWRLARFLADPVVLRSSPACASILRSPPATDSVLIRQARGLVAQQGVTPWPEPPGLNSALGRFLHAALKRILTPREALERAALQFREPGALPESPVEAAGAGGAPSIGTDPSPNVREGAAGSQSGAANGGYPGPPGSSPAPRPNPSTAPGYAPPPATDPASPPPGPGSAALPPSGFPRHSVGTPGNP
jgi:ABC-type glycerol-3-phosphate transport system substrate-binding protein